MAKRNRCCGQKDYPPATDMISSCTICYLTNRQEPHLEWFLDSLDNQLGPDRPRIVVVDFWKDERGQNGVPSLDVRGAIHTMVKPNVWQGPHRLTKENWWAKSNALNTALCLSSTQFTAYVDDLSVLGQQWVQALKEAIAGNYFIFGAYEKAKNMVVEKGILKSWNVYATDNRIRGNQGPVKCGGGWLFGCSLAGPTEQFLEVGGWPEMADGLSFEDNLMGFSLQNRNFDLRYDERMFTTESEDDHGKGIVFRRTDKGVSPKDKSHKALEIARATTFWTNPIPGGIRHARDAALRGEGFQVQVEPTQDWFDQQPISEMI